jgi:catechol 2,3-dioxygenase-like lactoylglutathione lyase family enzyme
MSGIVFYATERHDAVIDFYTDRLGADVWLEQPDCTVLKHDNLLVGFCARDRTDDCGILTFVYPDREAVDAVHADLSDVAREAPHENERYDIYQFFAEDPDGRTVEVQTFLHPVDL